MKRAFLLPLLLLGNCFALLAQDAQSVLWKISGNGLKKSSYLFGTIHVAPISLLDKFPRLARTAENCDFGIFESGGSFIGEAPAMPDYNQPPLDSLFTPEEYALVDSFFTASPHGSIRPHNNDADLFSMIQVVIVAKENAANPQHDSFDDLLHAKLLNAGKATFHLDDQADIEKIKEGLNYRRLAKYLVGIIQQTIDTGIRDDKGIHLALYEASMRSSLKLDQEVDKQIENVTVERNIKWLPKIEQQMKQGSSFIAVGLGHLKYKTGLIQLLKSSGYTLTPVDL